MKTKTPLAWLLAASISATGIHSAYSQGSLTPPGAPAPTMKSLDQIEPRTVINATNTPGDADSLFKITQPGSYYLTGNITGVAGKHGIEIAASGVTLDLNGFDLAGIPAMGAFDGVNVATVFFLTNIAVVHGSVRNWGGDGVDMSAGSAASSCRVDGVLASGNTDSGIKSSQGSTVTNCTASGNTGSGISGSAVINCSASGNTGYGIHGSAVSSCSAVGNTAGGIFATAITNCSASSNGGHGIFANPGGAVTNCSAGSNAGNGIHAVNLGAGGPYYTTGTTITKCSAWANGGDGIHTAIGCTITNCSVDDNGTNGIVCSSRCVIRGNTVASRASAPPVGNFAGIRVTGSSNLIEGNNCTDLIRGISVDGTGNIVIGNTCSGNTSNWEIAIGNSVGEIVTAGTNAAPISGNGSAASTLGSTDPTANFSH